MDNHKTKTDENATATFDTKTEGKDEPEKSSRNPVLKRLYKIKTSGSYRHIATTEGASLKSLLLLALVIIVSGISYCYVISGRTVLATVAAACITGLYLCWHPEHSVLLAPVYAILEGAVLGQISAHEETACNGIVLQAVVATFGLALLVALTYCKKWFRVSEAFRGNIVLVTGAIALLYLTDLVLIVGFDANIPLLHDLGWKGIGISLIVIIIAASNLAGDFADIDSLTEKGYPAYYEWYFAFAFMVSMIWLYLEVLNLFRKIKR